MTTQVWFKNPYYYAPELVDVGYYWFSWDRDFVREQKLNMDGWAGTTVPSTVAHWRSLVVSREGATEYGDGHGLANPKAAYPVWAYGQDWDILAELFEMPIGEDEELCTDTSIPVEYRPVLGQEHRIVIVDAPRSRSFVGKKFIQSLSDLQKAHPEAIVHLHNLQAFDVLFGSGLRAVSYDPARQANSGKLAMPTGVAVSVEDLGAAEYDKWLDLMGFKRKELEVVRNRVFFNIRSALWAGKYYDTNLGPRTARLNHAPDDSTPAASFTPAGSPGPRKTAAQPGDMMLCDTCSLSKECRFYRVGAACSIPDSEPKQLVDFFGTRNADQILEGLALLLRGQAVRFQNGVAIEQAEGGISREVTAIANSILAGGEKLAKMLNPGLRAAPRVNVTTNVGVITGGSGASDDDAPARLMAWAIGELEREGMNRADITMTQIKQKMGEAAMNRMTAKALEAAPEDPSITDAEVVP